MAAAETIKSTIDQYTSAGADAFKGAMQKSLSALNEASGHSKKNLEAVVASFTAAAKGAESLGSQAMAFSKSSFEGQVAAAKSMAGAKSIQDVVELQSTYAKSALDTYLSEMRKISETVAGSVKDSLKPLGERATTVVSDWKVVR
jgi:phasin family protein